MRGIDVAVLGLRRLSRSPGIWISMLLFVGVIVVGVAIPAFVLEEADAAIGAAFLLGPGVDLILPVIAVIGTYASISGIIADGRIKIFLGTPTNRSNVLLGILFSRIIIVCSIAMGGIFAGVLALIGLYGLPPIGPILGFAGLTLIASASYVAIGVGVSAMMGSSVRALGVLIGVFVIGNTLWEPAWRGGYYLLGNSVPGDDPPRWLELMMLVSPFESYTTVADGILPRSPHLAIAIDESGAAAEAGPLVGADLAPLDGAMAIAVIVIWAIISLLVGYRALETVDIR